MKGDKIRLALGAVLAACFGVSGNLASAAASDAVATPGDGAGVFRQRCALCHSVKPETRSGIGPTLAGIANSPAARVPGFAYSRALRGSGIVWTDATLDAFLLSPGKMISGTRHAVSVPDAGQRAALVAYLMSLKLQDRTE